MDVNKKYLSLGSPINRGIQEVHMQMGVNKHK